MGVYVHVPFCMRRCKYCAFVSSVPVRVPDEDYVKAILVEFDARISRFEKYPLWTVYFGGGTPSMLSDGAICEILSHILRKMGSPEEVTLEVNPEHVSEDRARRWHEMGITRISLGIQSFDEDMLQFLGRRHTGMQAKKSLEILKKCGFDDVSLDLIYGGCYRPMDASEAMDRWRKDLETASQYAPSHVSCYELTIEPHTPLWTAQKRGTTVLCDEDEILEMMRMIPETLGMHRYEISNYSREGYFSAHNLSCWAGLPYLGLGPGAHSFLFTDQCICRWSNGHQIRQWILAVLDHPHDLPNPEFKEELSAQMHLAERLMCAARTLLCWNPDEIAAQIHADIEPFRSGLNKAIQYGWLHEIGDGLLQTTELGIELNNCLDQLIFEGAPD